MFLRGVLLLFGLALKALVSKDGGAIPLDKCWMCVYLWLCTFVNKKSEQERLNTPFTIVIRTYFMSYQGV